MAEFYACNKCHGEFTNKEVEVDHIIPVVNPSVGFTSWDDFIAGLYSYKENYQLICKACHKDKSNQEKQKKVK